MMLITVFYGLGYFSNRRSESAKVAGWTKTMNSPTFGTSETAKQYRLRTTGKISQNKTMPPQPAVTLRTGTGLVPLKKTALLSNILDIDGNKKYQCINSFRKGCSPEWREWWIWIEVHHSILSIHLSKYCSK
jgi:hypothetical protein